MNTNTERTASQMIAGDRFRSTDLQGLTFTYMVVTEVRDVYGDGSRYTFDAVNETTGRVVIFTNNSEHFYQIV